MSFRDRYFEALGLKIEPEPLPEEASKKLSAALARAHEIRKFEIELYWKRATYFWAFQAISFTAVGLSLKDGEIKSPAILIGAAALGVLTGFAGYLTASGSKFWQENWEAHVDMLEDVAGEGRLTQAVIGKAKPASSVSRVNRSLLAFITLGWLSVLVFEACPWAQREIGDLSENGRSTALLLAVLAACGWMWSMTRTRLTGNLYSEGDAFWHRYSTRKTSKKNQPKWRLIWRDPPGYQRQIEPPSDGLP